MHTANLKIADVRSLCENLEALMERDLLTLSIREMMTELLKEEVLKTDRQFAEICSKLNAGQAGFCLDCVNSQESDLRKDGICALVGKSQRNEELEPYQQLSIQKLQHEQEVYEEVSISGSRDHCRLTLKNAAGWVARSITYIRATELQASILYAAVSGKH
jgi:hypothetical protein